MSDDFQAFAHEDFCYLTTTDRVSGRPHTIEIWYVLNGRTMYLLSGGEAAWIDGASTFQALFRVLLQIAAPGNAVVGVWSFLVAWTNFFVPLIILQSKS